MIMDDLTRVAGALERADRFLLTTHFHPDGDALGSMLSLGQALTSRGKRVAMVLMEGVPSPYTFLPGAGEVGNTPPEDFEPDLLVSLDCADQERMALPPGSRDLGLMILNIDHHISNRMFGAINLVDAEASATGEVVYRLLRTGGYRFTKEIATALYVAIATDTGFFRYANASREALKIAAGLVVDFDLDPGKIAEVVHEQKSLNAVKLLGEVLGTLKLAVGGTVSWMYLDQEMLGRYPVELEETEGFINYARSINGVEIALFFKEAKEGEIRVSWRSGATADVSQLASYFGGGGHARAAGCTISESLPNAVDKVLGFLSSWKGLAGE